MFNREAASAALFALIKPLESFSPVPYRDSNGIWTIGYGQTRLPDGSRVTQHTPPTTESAAAQELTTSINSLIDRVAACVVPDINTAQLVALVDFAYNCGLNALQGSTLLRLLNAGDFKGASAQFPEWVHDHAGNVLSGLVKRRQLERDLFDGRTPLPGENPVAEAQAALQKLEDDVGLSHQG